MAANDQLPLTLDLGSVAARGGSATIPVPRPESRTGLYAVLALVFVGIAYGAFHVLRSGKSQNASVAAAPAAAPLQPTAAPPTSIDAPKPTEPAAQAAPTSVSVALSSEPAGAELSVDGKPQGTTPASLSLTAGTEVELSLKSPGFATKTQKLKIEPGTQAQTFKLEPLPYELTIVSEPKGAQITAGALSAESPKPLVLGHLDAPIEVSVEKAGYQRLSRTVQLVEFKEAAAVMRAELSLSLTALPVAVPARRAAPVAARAAKPPTPIEAAPPAPIADTPVVQIKPAGSEEAAAPPPAAAAAAAPASAAPKPAEAAPPPAPPEPAVPPAP